MICFRFGIAILFTSFSSSLTYAQVSFEKILPLPPASPFEVIIDKVRDGDMAFADIDGDNDSDLLITGTVYKSGTNQPKPITKLYTNDGNGLFTELGGTSLTGVQYSSVAFGDIDGDNDQDILISGDTTWSGGVPHPITKLYANNGSGSYTEVTGVPFENVQEGAVAFSDVDGDNDLDVLITGRNVNYTGVAKLYTNDGTGSFTVSSGAPFLAASYSAAAFADVDGDNDQDLLISGQGSGQLISKLYLNNGSGLFSQSSQSLVGVKNGAVAFADIDGDNDQDLLITGDDNLGVGLNPRASANLYTNNGSGTFSLVPNAGLEQAYESEVVFADIDGDNDQDLLITGLNGSLFPVVSKLYSNNGMGAFSVMQNNNLADVFGGGAAFADIDGDNDLDLLITGALSNSGSVGYASTKVYSNVGGGTYLEMTGSAIRGLIGRRSSAAFGDFDGDNDQDLALTGVKPDGGVFDGRTILYQNDGQGNYSAFPVNNLDSVYQGAIAVADVDGDNDVDLVLNGRNPTNGQGMCKLYLNNGLAVFSEAQGTTFAGASIGDLAFADVDNDNDPDLLITGSGPLGRISKLYRNNGTGGFTEVTNTPFVGTNNSTIAFADIDGDNDQDLLIAGDTASSRRSMNLYINGGTGNYTLAANQPFPTGSGCDFEFADMDGDSDQDLVLIGCGPSELYLNDGAGSFTLDTSFSIDRVSGGSLAIADFDGNSAMDVVVTGRVPGQPMVETKLYLNNGNAIFSELFGSPSSQDFGGGEIVVTDFDGDNKPDLLISGFSYRTDRYHSNLYRNTSSSIGLFDQTERSLLSLHPNPVDDELILSLPAALGEKVVVEIVNPQGKLIYTTKVILTANHTSLELSHLENGIYYIKVKATKQIFSGSFMKI